MTLQRRTPLGRGGSLLRRTALVAKVGFAPRTKPLPRESVKRKRSAPTRRRLNKTLLDGRLCCRCLERRAVELHEPLKRSRRPGSHLDENLVVPSCRECNSYAEAEPRAAASEDWLIHSASPYDEAARICAWWRSRSAA